MTANWFRGIAGLVLSCSVVLADGVKLVEYPRQTETDFNGNQRYVVEDADAKHGTAQAAIPGKSKPGGPICSFYSYARPAGVYRTIWRVKVDDNTIEDLVFRASTDRGSISLKGTDFAKPNTYQDFSYTAEKDEGGFFGVSASWPGKGRVHVDSVTVVSEKLFTEKELLAKKGGLDLPDVWSFPPPAPPHLHMAKGLWWDFFGLNEAVSELKGAIITASYHAKGQYGTSLRHFPSSWQQLMENNLVILANVDAPALGARGRLLIEEFVMNGGSLLVLGGPFALGPGQYRFTALEKLLPCQMSSDDRRKAEGEFVMKPTGAAADVLPKDLSWQMAPRLYYYHPLEAKPGARILVTAGEKPVVVIWETGNGRVGVIAATAEGMPGPGELAFWEWGDMPVLVASVCRWLLAVPRDEKPQVMDEDARKSLEKLAVPNPGDEEAERQRLLSQLLSKCRDKAFAREMLSTIDNAESAPDRRFVDAVAQTVRPFVAEEFSEEAEALVESQATGKVALGLRVLGLSRAAGAAKTLRKFLDQGAGGSSSGNVEDSLERGGGLSVDSGLEIGANEHLKLAAVFGLGDLGDPGCLDALRRATLEFAKKRQDLTEADDVPDLNENIYQQSLAARCRLGDAQAVGPFLDAVLKNGDEIEQFLNAFDTMIPNKDDKKLMNMLKVGGIRLPILYRRQALCSEMLTRVPYSLAGQFAEELAKRNHPLLTPFGYCVLTPGPKRNLTPEAVPSMLALFRNCTIPGLRRLAFSLVSDLNEPQARAKLAAALEELMASGNPGSARFALRVLPRLDPKERLPVVSAGLKHPDPEVRRLATLSLPLLGEAERAKLGPEGK